jgi:hypothetical protein
MLNSEELTGRRKILKLEHAMTSHGDRFPCPHVNLLAKPSPHTLKALVLILKALPHHAEGFEHDVIFADQLYALPRHQQDLVFRDVERVREKTPYAGTAEMLYEPEIHCDPHPLDIVSVMDFLRIRPCPS